ACASRAQFSCTTASCTSRSCCWWATSISRCCTRRRATRCAGSRSAPSTRSGRHAITRNGGQNRSMTTILVVDDEPIVRDVIVRYLKRDGFATLEAGDGDDARRLIETGNPSLVVLDVMLPGVDGLELCRWIRGRSDLPVIMLTARGEEADRIVGLELGA